VLVPAAVKPPACPILANENTRLSVKPRSRRRTSRVIGGDVWARHCGGPDLGGRSALDAKCVRLGGKEEGFMEMS
jgi:hypothetical protein